MAIFAISDLHLSLGGDKPMSVFGDKWENYTDKMMQKWNSIVTENDLVVIPGDISWATYIEDAITDFSYINALKGKKLIFKGNHDYWWTTPSKMSVFLKNNAFNSIEILQNKSFVYEDVTICGTRGWTYPSTSGMSEDRKIFEREKQRLILSLEDGVSKRPRELIVAMHYPPVDMTTGASDFIDIMREYNVKTCIYGHLHAASCASAPMGNINGVSLKLVACDYLNFTPLLIK